MLCVKRSNLATSSTPLHNSRITFLPGVKKVFWNISLRCENLCGHDCILYCIITCIPNQLNNQTANRTIDWVFHLIILSLDDKR